MACAARSNCARELTFLASRNRWRSNSLWASANCAWAAATPACAARSELSWSCGSSLATTWSGSSRSPTLAARSIMRPPMRKATRVSFSASIRPVNATVSPLSRLTTVTVRTGRTSGGAVSASGTQAASIAVARSRSEKREPIACPKHADIPRPRLAAWASPPIHEAGTLRLGRGGAYHANNVGETKCHASEPRSGGTPEHAAGPTPRGRWYLDQPLTALVACRRLGGNRRARLQKHSKALTVSRRTSSCPSGWLGSWSWAISWAASILCVRNMEDCDAVRQRRFHFPQLLGRRLHSVRLHRVVLAAHHSIHGPVSASRYLRLAKSDLGHSANHIPAPCRVGVPDHAKPRDGRAKYPTSSASAR